MVRGPIEDGYNLAIGEPVLLQHHLRFPPMALHGPYEYPALGGATRLLEELHLLHPDKYVVIANGAKQGLLAAFHALKEWDGRQIVRVTAPYWPSYPTLAALAGLKFVPNYFHPYPYSENLTCLTAPNNPDGDGGFDAEVTIPVHDVWDSVYAHWVYGWGGHEPRHRIRVCSASKLLGLSGLRVGWLVTEEEDLANEARLYVERTTSGVSAPAQEYVAHALRHMRLGNHYNELWAAREDMLANGEDFRNILGPYCQQIQGVPASEQGMFAYFRVHNDLIGERFNWALGDARVALVSGEACGAKEPGWYRMNMMERRTTTRAALNAIKEHLG